MSEHVGSLSVTDNLVVSGSDFQTGLSTHTIPALVLKDFPNANGWEKMHSTVDTALAASSGKLNLSGGNSYHLAPWIHRSMRAKNGIWRYKVDNLSAFQVAAVQDVDNMVGIFHLGGVLYYWKRVGGALKYYQNDNTVPRLLMGKVGTRFDGTSGTQYNVLFDWNKPGEVIVARYEDFLYFGICEENGRLVRTFSINEPALATLDLQGFGISKSGAGTTGILEADFTSLSDKGLQQFICVGDSQTWGQIKQYVDGSNQYTYAGLGRGWVNHLYQYMRGQNKIIRNQGQPGGTTADVKADLDLHFRGVNADINTTLLLYLGVNDMYTPATRNDSAEVVYGRWLDIVKYAKAQPGVQKVLGFTIPMATAVPRPDWPNNQANVDSWNVKLRALNKLIIQGASANGYEVYDMAQVTISPTDEKKLKPGYLPNNDGIHFTEAAHIQFAKTLRPQTMRRVQAGSNASADVSAVAESFTSALDTKLAAQRSDVGESNIGKTAQTVMKVTAGGKVQISSGGDGNVIEVFQTGENKSKGVVKERKFMALGEVALLTGLEDGSVITSTKGICGASECRNGNNESPMPLAPEGMGGRQFFLFAYRNAASGDGRVYVAAGAVPAEVSLLNGAGTATVDGPKKIPAFGIAEFKTNAVAEFQVVADQNVFVATAGGMNGNTFRDLRLVPPLSTELIGNVNQAKVSALYANTEVTWHTRGGQTGTFSVSPGGAVDLRATVLAGGSSGATSDYNPLGAVILRAKGPISCYSGADGAGTEATPFMPLNMLSQRVPVPFATVTGASNGRNATSSIAVMSPYKGTARVYDTSGTLVATLPLSRTVADPTAAQQQAPCAAIFGINSGSTVRLAANYPGGYIEADVPISVVMNSDRNETIVSGGLVTEDDETALLGVTPEDIKTIVRRDVSGVLRRQVIAADGTITWPKC